MNIFKRLKDFIISLLNDTHGEVVSADDSVYVINGVRYIVSTKHSETESMTFIDKIKRYLGSDFAHLTTAEDINTINTECVCMTAGKED
ncbi:MAG: hypothetical protein J6A97_04635 [Clostridia bacterium]|nr:hypothetical protein [Clostridia bacterium]